MARRPVPLAPCFACGGRAWWLARQYDGRPWTCSRCHPPAPGLEIVEARPSDLQERGAGDGWELSARTSE